MIAYGGGLPPPLLDPDIEATIDRAEVVIGVELLDWQRRYLRAALTGQQVVWHKGRRGGWTTVQLAGEAIRDAL